MNKLKQLSNGCLDLVLGIIVFLVTLVVGYFVIVISFAGVALWYTQASAVSVYIAFSRR